MIERRACIFKNYKSKTLIAYIFLYTLHFQGDLNYCCAQRPEHVLCLENSLWIVSCAKGLGHPESACCLLSWCLPHWRTKSDKGKGKPRGPSVRCQASAVSRVAIRPDFDQTAWFSSSLSGLGNHSSLLGVCLDFWHTTANNVYMYSNSI